MSLSGTRRTLMLMKKRLEELADRLAKTDTAAGR